MYAVEIYVVAIIMSATSAQEPRQGSQNCSDYCKLITHQSNITYASRSDCNCSSFNHRKVSLRQREPRGLSSANIADSDSYEPLHSASKETIRNYGQNVLLFNRFINTESNEIESNILNRKLSSTSDSQESQAELDGKQQNLNDMITTKNELPLYLDIELYQTAKNKFTNYKGLGNMLKNFHLVEKTISECFNLHIFIFSKNNNESSTDSGRNFEHYDNLTKSKILTELRSKCNTTSNLVKQSVKDIKESSLNAKKKNRYSKEAKESHYNPMKTSQKTAVSVPHAKSTHEGRNALVNVKTAKLENRYSTEKYSDSISTNSDIFKSNYEKVKYSGQDNTKTSKKTNNEYFENSSNQDPIHSLIVQRNVNKLESDSTTSMEINDQTTMQYKNTDFINNNVATATISQNLTIHSYNEQTIMNTTSRAEYHEGEYLIPKIITKEFSNNTVTGIIDGYEIIPNSDYKYINQSTVSEVLHKSVDSEVTPDLKELSASVAEPSNEKYDFLETNNKTTSKANILEIKGQLYFLYGTKLLPTRFIQSSDGKLHLAINGLALCQQFLRQKRNKSVFMTMLCNCIVFDICSQAEMGKM